MQDRILVTGGAGFIGSCFVRHWLLTETAPVVNLDKLTYAGNLESLGAARNDPRHRFVLGDIGDLERVAELLRAERPRAIVHLAAESHVDRSIDGPLAFVETNVLGTCRLLQATRQYWESLPSAERSAFRFVNVSTDEIYGSAGPDEAFVEGRVQTPNSPYAASKAAAGHLVRAYRETYGLPTLETVCSNNYGPYQFPEKLVPLMILNAREGRDLPVYGAGDQERDWLHVEDHCSALRLVLQNGRIGATYHIGGEGPRSNLSVVTRICDAVEQQCPQLTRRPHDGIRHVPDRPGHDRRYAIDSTRIRTELGWRPVYEWGRGLDETVRWYLANDTWVAGVTSGVYRRQRLGLAAIEEGEG